MDDVLGYSGRRCIVTGAASGMGEATARILVDLGAEVHAVDIRKPDIAGLASYSETDLQDPAAIERTVDDDRQRRQQPLQLRGSAQRLPAARR